MVSVDGLTDRGFFFMHGRTALMYSGWIAEVRMEEWAALIGSPYLLGSRGRR